MELETLEKRSELFQSLAVHVNAECACPDSFGCWEIRRKLCGDERATRLGEERREA